jgi:hypothetical protein
MEARRMGAELFHADGQLDRLGEANSRFCYLANAPNIECLAGNIPHSHQLLDLIVLYLTVTLQHIMTYLTLRKHLMKLTFL